VAEAATDARSWVTERLRGVVLTAILAAAVSGCGSSSSERSPTTSSSPPPPPTPLVGSGSSLIAPLMERWQSDYADATGAKVTYHPTGNGVDIGGIASGNTDFSASDAPVTPVQFGEGAAQGFPWALSGTVVIYNLNGVSNHLKLSGETLGNIFLGRIAAWNDPAIAALNPEVALPETTITPVYRSGSSGDTYLLAYYLTANSSAFRTHAGISEKIRKAPGGIGARNQEAVAKKVAEIDGSIGYVSLPYALSRKPDIALIENSAGNFPEPNAKTVEVAAKAGSRIGPNNETSIAELPASAKSGYPISGYTYVVVPSQPKRAVELRKFLTYAIGPAAQAFGPKLGFAPLPSKDVAADKRAIAAIEG
jgi:phosphate transport system substrate-binding protein